MDQRGEITIADEKSGTALAVLNLTMAEVAVLMSGRMVHLPADRVAVAHPVEYARVGKTLKTWSKTVPWEVASSSDQDVALTWARDNRPAGHPDDVEVRVRWGRRGWEAIYHMWTEDPS